VKQRKKDASRPGEGSGVWGVSVCDCLVRAYIRMRSLSHNCRRQKISVGWLVVMLENLDRRDDVKEKNGKEKRIEMRFVHLANVVKTDGTNICCMFLQSPTSPNHNDKIEVEVI
jgi:hypothetical protein